METRSHLKFVLGKLPLCICSCATGILFSIGHAQAEQRVLQLEQIEAAEAAKVLGLLLESDKGIGVDERTNSLVLVGDDPELLGRLEVVIAKLDSTQQGKPEKKQEDKLLKRELKYLPAADFLSMVALGMERDAKANHTSGTNWLAIGETLMVADPQLNLVIVSGSEEHRRLIGLMADEIDVRPRQVYIKAIVVEVTLDDDLKYGLDALPEGTFAKAELAGDAGDEGKGEEIEVIKVRKMASTRGAILEITSSADPPPAKLFTINNDLELYLNALAGKSDKIEAIASTHVFAINNQESPISTVKGLEITVEPLINSKDEVTLDLAIEFAGSVKGDPNSPSLQALQTKVRLADRAALISGGHIREEDGVRKELLVIVQPSLFPEEEIEVDESVPKAVPIKNDE